MKTNFGCIISTSGAMSLYIDNKVHNINTDHINYEAIKNKIKKKKYSEISALCDVTQSILTKSKNKVQIKSGRIYYGDHEIKNSVAKKILELVKKDYPFEFMVNFLNNMLENETPSCIDELYDFLEYGKIPITTDGCFLAFKRVRDDYKDFYTGTLDHSVGQEVSMPREQVKDDRTITCASGLHFCSLSYLSSYHDGQGKVVIVKVNPKDVVSIPIDYGFTKGRCCKYTVVAEHKSDSDKVEDFKSDVYEKNGEQLDLNKYIKKYHNVRDNSGRFVKKSSENKSTVKHIKGLSYHNVRGSDGKFVKKISQTIKSSSTGKKKNR